MLWMGSVVGRLSVVFDFEAVMEGQGAYQSGMGGKSQSRKEAAARIALSEKCTQNYYDFIYSQYSTA